MAAKALGHQMTRMVRVNRETLLETLKKNREKHLTEFNEAMAGYRRLALDKVLTAFSGLSSRIESRRAEIVEKVSTFTAETASNFSDYLVILEQVAINLKVPVSYVDAYDAAIDMAAFDTRDELELSGAEFQCFCRDVWDWTHEFANTTTMYGLKGK